jgi:hypothetical protein
VIQHWLFPNSWLSPQDSKMLGTSQTRAPCSAAANVLPRRMLSTSRTLLKDPSARPSVMCQPRPVPKHAACIATPAHQRKPNTPYMVVQSMPGYTPVGGDARIKVIGVGGGGNNALNRMIASGLQVRVVLCCMAQQANGFENPCDSHGQSTCTQGVEFWAVNTDAQALANHAALNKVQIGTELTRGLGCGGNPNLGQQAALESQEALKNMVQVSGEGN